MSTPNLGQLQQQSVSPLSLSTDSINSSGGGGGGKSNSTENINNLASKRVTNGLVGSRQQPPQQQPSKIYNGPLPASEDGNELINGGNTKSIVEIFNNRSRHSPTFSKTKPVTSTFELLDSLSTSGGSVSPSSQQQQQHQQQSSTPTGRTNIASTSKSFLKTGGSGNGSGTTQQAGSGAARSSTTTPTEPIRSDNGPSDADTLNLLDSIVTLSKSSSSLSNSTSSSTSSNDAQPSQSQPTTVNTNNNNNKNNINDHSSSKSNSSLNTPDVTSPSITSPTKDVSSPLLISALNTTTITHKPSSTTPSTPSTPAIQTTPAPTTPSTPASTTTSSSDSKLVINKTTTATPPSTTPDRARLKPLALIVGSTQAPPPPNATPTSTTPSLESPRVISPGINSQQTIPNSNGSRLNIVGGSMANITNFMNSYNNPNSSGNNNVNNSNSGNNSGNNSSNTQSPSMKPMVVKINREGSSQNIWKSTLSAQAKDESVKVCFDEIPGKKLVQRVSIDLTPLEVKKIFLEEVGPEFLLMVDQYELKVLSINATFTNESLPLRRQLILQACNISRLFPKLQLTLKNTTELKLPDSELVDLKKHIQTELEIFDLIGSNITRILDSGKEVSSFRRDLAHFRLQNQGNSPYNDLLQYIYVLSEPMPLIVPPKLTLMVIMSGTTKISKRIDCDPNITIGELKQQIFKKYAIVDPTVAKDKSSSNFVIKVTGFREYILSTAELGDMSLMNEVKPTGKNGDFALLDYDYVRQCINKQQVVELSFIDTSLLPSTISSSLSSSSSPMKSIEQPSVIDKLLDNTDYDSDDESTLLRDEDLLEDQQPQSNVSASSLVLNQNNNNNNQNNNGSNSNEIPVASRILKSGKLSITKVNRLFRVKIIGLRNINLSISEEAMKKFEDSSKTPYVYVMVELYHGSDLIANPTFSPTTPITAFDNLSFPDWDKDVFTTFNISIRQLPRATRACFTVFVTGGANDVVAEGSSKSIPLAWVNCKLIDHKGVLKTGPVAFKLWEDGRANPIGTCVENIASKNPTVLLVEFETFVKPIIFIPPTLNSITKQDTPPKKLEPNEARKLNNLMQSDPLVILTPEDKKLIYNYRHIYTSKPKSLAKFLACINWLDTDQMFEAYRLLKEWVPLKPVQALELLDAKFADDTVRSYAVQTLKSFSDADFSDFLLQLTQVLKYEPYHKSELSMTLIQRALSNRSRIGHSFFWFLKSEMHTPEIEDRYGLLLEGYLRSCGSHRQELVKQNQVIKALYQVAMLVKEKNSAADRKKVLLDGLAKIKFPETFQLPLDPRWEAKGLIVDKCRYMDSKKLPLWLVFENVEQHAKPLTVIFKVGDDLRQDSLTLQILRIMDKFWKNGGLDLRLQPYKCVSTGDGIGMLEVVLNANTIANINKDAGGTSALLEEKTLVNWLKESNPSETDMNKAVETFILSCAGYVVATYVLGIGDRHADNIMLTRMGHLFHIDFGHFLGNYKKKYGFKRERAPFIFTAQYMAIVGGKESENFKFFVNTCCLAYNILRKNSDLFITLFVLMLSTGIPELQCAEDIDYLRNALAPDLTDAEAAEEFTKNIIVALNTKTVLLNDLFHHFAHK